MLQLVSKRACLLGAVQVVHTGFLGYFCWTTVAENDTNESGKTKPKQESCRSDKQNNELKEALRLRRAEGRSFSMDSSLQEQSDPIFI